MKRVKVVTTMLFGIIVVVNLVITAGILIEFASIREEVKSFHNLKQELEHRILEDKYAVAVETHTVEHDFGQVKRKGGVVSTQFEIENHGKGTLKLFNISTSCGCTSAEIEKGELGEGETTILTVKFDPDFHKEPQGRLERKVFVDTNDQEVPELEFTIYAEIIE